MKLRIHFEKKKEAKANDNATTASWGINLESKIEMGSQFTYFVRDILPDRYNEGSSGRKGGSYIHQLNQYVVTENLQQRADCEHQLQHYSILTHWCECWENSYKQTPKCFWKKNP